ncbi:helix-turn-helix transcriptional regulator [Actinomadura rugatobispora]|uniref:AAA family ATPase n=1 Tax=Actinomadura rugatobispora TaxID=1994 RepID=A0ABW1A1I6_9ACTN|nr:LuxR family transcriptional regulator [Actinomadura rugatobispora]
MTARVLSPVLVGRSAELGDLEEALAHAPGAVLVGGEAGLGKTRLIREFAATVRNGDAGVRLLVGGCLELGSDGLPFAPFTTVLRGLVRDIGIEGVAELLPRGDTAGLARLLPEFGEPETDAASAEERARLFELVLILLERLAERGPVVLVIEDAHWADRSTRDLLAFLVRNADTAPLLIVTTYRTDELHRAHPLRPLLAGLARVDRVRRLELNRLSRGDVSRMVAGLRGEEPPAALVERIHARSEGNPLFVEFLLEADDGGKQGELPESLRDLLLAGVQRLPEETQDVLRDASGGGTRIEHALLAAVSGLDDARLTRVLRPAVAANVLVVDGDGYAFRHALIREAIHDDLLPGEHTRLHTRYAQALEGEPGLVPARRLWVELSHHWLSAHDATWALVSAWRAAGEARKALAYAEQLAMLWRVLELWERVPDAPDRIGAAHLDVLEQAAIAADLAGEFDRGIKLATSALKATGTGEGTGPRRAALLELRGRMRHQMALPGFVEDLQEAVRCIPPDPPTELRARTLSTLATYVRLTTDIEVARRAAAESLEIAQRIGALSAEVDARTTLFCVDIDYDADEAALTEVEERARRAGSPRSLLRVAVIKSHFLEGAGRHEEAVEVAHRGMELAREYGVARTQGTFLGINRAEPLVSLGRWDEARTVLRQAMEQDPAITIRTSLVVLDGEVALALGDLATARDRLAEAREIMDLKMKWLKTQDFFATLRLEAQVRMAEGRPDAALAAVRGVIATPGLPDDSRYAWPVLVIGAAACAELGDAATIDGAAAFPQLRARVAGLDTRSPAQEAYQRAFEAEATRVLDEPDPEVWDASAAAWEALRRPYQRAEALLRAAEAALARGDHGAAAERLDRAADLAGELKARPLCERIAECGRRLRRRDEAAPLGLTPREFEVLRLVAEGQSNRDIAAALVISVKTASVHVSNILAKLEVGSRGEAAATAHRLGLFQPTRTG